MAQISHLKQWDVIGIRVKIRQVYILLSFNIGHWGEKYRMAVHLANDW